ncbi:MAG: hypothetical protein OXF05_07725 [Hyphomicrobiales bacterium]|nr:hypothetical protein [Hyphomicrobiales bacterium]
MLEFLIIVLIIYILADGDLLGFIRGVLKMLVVICLVLLLIILIAQ